MKRRISLLLAALMICALLPVEAFALTPTYSVSAEYQASKYYAQLTAVTLTNDQRSNLVKIAKSQIGYHEGNSSSELGGDNLSGSKNYTEYGRWFGFQISWCAIFISWCARQAGIPTSIINTTFSPSCDSFGCVWHGRSADRSGGINYTPRPGDIIVFDWTENGYNTDSPASAYGEHVGIVIDVDGSRVYTVEGNTTDNATGQKSCCVELKNRSLSSDNIKGYAVPKYTSDSNTQGTTYQTVMLDANGGSCSMSEIRVANGDKLISLPTPTWAEHDFLGWYTSTTEGTKFSQDTPIFSDMTLFARWETHQHDYSATKTTAPTCTAQGYTTYTCSCGDSYKADYKAPTGHNYGDPVYEWSDGHTVCVGKRYCQNDGCSECFSEKGALKDSVIKKATCTSAGERVVLAVFNCKAFYAQEVKLEIPALDHSYKDGVCTVCGEKDPDFMVAPVVSITTSAGKPKLSWNAIEGATKYWVYRSTDGKNFKYYDMTTNTTYTNKSTSIGTTYYYQVKAVKVVDGQNVVSDLSNIAKIMCAPSAPTVSISRSNGKPKLSWSKVTGATKYWIYRSTDGGKTYKYYDCTTKTSYTNTGAASGTTYYYKVKAVAVVDGNNVTSAYSSAKSLFTSLATPTAKITTSNGKPKISWNAVTGVDKYYIYRSTDGKNFSYYDSTVKTSYTNTGAKKGTKYYYKVKAVCTSNSNANSAQSKAVSIKATK